MSPRIFLAVLLPLGLAACELVYKLPTRQGNVIEQKQLDKLEVGMSRAQVRFLLGTPIADSALDEARWDYLGYYKSPRGRVFSRAVHLYFEGDKLARMEGIEAPAGDGTAPEHEDLEAQQKKDRTEAERGAEATDAGIVITPE